MQLGLPQSQVVGHRRVRRLVHRVQHVAEAGEDDGYTGEDVGDLGSAVGGIWRDIRDEELEEHEANEVESSRDHERNRVAAG